MRRVGRSFSFTKYFLAAVCILIGTRDQSNIIYEQILKAAFLPRGEKKNSAIWQQKCYQHKVNPHFLTISLFVANLKAQFSIVFVTYPSTCCAQRPILLVEACYL